MGPNAIGVGATVLAALTDPPEGRYAREWRDEAHQYQQRRTDALAARGALIRLGAPVTLRSGTVVDTVEVVGLRLWRAQSGLRIRPHWDWFMSSWQLSAPVV